MVAIAENYRPFIEWRRGEIEQVGSEDELYLALERVARRSRRARERDSREHDDGGD